MRIDAHEQSWPLDKPFRIARGTRTEARVVVVAVSDGQCETVCLKASFVRVRRCALISKERRKAISDF